MTIVATARTLTLPPSVEIMTVPFGVNMTLLTTDSPSPQPH